MQTLGSQLGGSLSGIGTEKAALGSHGFAHAGSVGLGALDGLRHDLYADQLPALTCHGKADGAHAAVEIQQRVVRGQLRVLRSNAVQPLGGKRVDLIEGQWSQPHRHAAKRVLNVARAVQDVIFTAQNDVGVFGVDVEQNGADGRELPPQCGAKLLCVGQLCPGAYQTHHDLPAVRAAPQEDMSHQPLAALLIVGADDLLCKKGAQRVANLVQHAGLQLAVRAGDDAVGAPCVKADAGHAVLVYAHRELHLVAVAVYVWRRQNIQHRHLQPADAAEGIQHAFLLGAQLCGIIQMPQAAPAAGACHRAVHRNAVRRGGEQLVQNAKGVPAAVLHDAHPCFVPGGGAGDKYGLAIGTVGHTAAVAGKTFDAQGQDLVFL